VLDVSGFSKSPWLLRSTLGHGNSNHLRLHSNILLW